MPIYQKWISEYGKINQGAQIDYQSTGSGTGVRQISEGTVDFGASDEPMKDDELKNARGGEILHIPTVLGAVIITYNLPEVKQELQFSPDVVADIFGVKINRWDAPRIKQYTRREPSGRHHSSPGRRRFPPAVSQTDLESHPAEGQHGQAADWPVASAQKATRRDGTINRTAHHRIRRAAFAAQQKLPARPSNSAANSRHATLDSVTAVAAARCGDPPIALSITTAEGEAATRFELHLRLVSSQRRGPRSRRSWLGGR